MQKLAHLINDKGNVWPNESEVLKTANHTPIFSAIGRNSPSSLDNRGPEAICVEQGLHPSMLNCFNKSSAYRLSVG